ncbi:SubName: Full=Uncharacterized protein {ECO:0000313/EMBL:CCA71362.1} [Serendipita indica DSM 11827]|uniref:Uncharacterized protein n=1 Tax=Serendipita indica (strain DSM 11827) TaxID=1109443 RepID=G4TJ69_SERID|nr:SubName: Full=Uncharacterized protein {ECO:0000313/EMBL:CCA71362.1} [Serendipita indica DSM 11827]CCA71362.1 hypothetical protein PIIN_05301 [Serendipita indica DSM 11827]
MRSKCIFKPIVRPATAQSLRQIHARPFDRPDENELFLKPPRKTNHLRSHSKQTLVLCKLLVQFWKQPANGDEEALEGHLMLVPSKRTRLLQTHEPAVQLVSFLVRLKQGDLATRVFSTYIHSGLRFSLDALRHLCLVASCLKQPTPLGNLVDEVVHAAPRSKSGVGVVNDLIVQLHFHRRWDAVLRLGSLAFEKNGLTLGAVQYRKTLQSLFHIHQAGRKAFPAESAVRIEGLLETLSLWINAREKAKEALNQYDLSVLIQGLASLLYKIHKREVSIPTQYRSLVINMINILSRGMNHPLSRMSMVEAVLNSQDAARIRMNGHKDPPTPLDSFKPLIHWAAHRRFELIEHEDDAMLVKANKMATRSRIAKILARGSVNTREDYGFFDHLQATVDIQNHLSTAVTGLGGVSANDVFALRLLAIESQKRFTSTLIRLCSRFLQSQSLPELFLLLPYTRHLHDLRTFSRLWRRALFMVVQKGCWDGDLGLKRLLSILVESRPPRWDEATIGEQLFASSSLAENSLRVAIVSISLVAHSTLSMEKVNEWMLDRPLPFREWSHLIDPFIRSLSLPWYEGLKMKEDSQIVADAAKSSHKLLGRMRNVA